MKKRILIVILCLGCITAYAQKKKRRRQAAPATQQTTDPSTSFSAQPAPDTTKRAVAVPMKPFERPLDGYYKKANITNAKVTPYPNLRESDVAYAKRVWREIDVREKMNTYLASPKQRLIDVIMAAVSAGEMTAYDANPTTAEPGGDTFSTPLTPEAAKAKLAGAPSLVETRDKDGNVISTKEVPGEFNPDSLLKFRIKEDWVFDRQRSIFEPRIIGIAPMLKVKGVASSDYQPAFWIYFPEARQVFATKEVVSRNSDATGLSFDDAFVKRIFTSYIVKVSNDKDERIKDYEQGIDRLTEAERIKKNLMDWELNLWQY